MLNTTHETDVLENNNEKNLKHRKTYLGAISEPCCIKDPMVNHKEFKRVK